jgi:hypothetical protein
MANSNIVPFNRKPDNTGLSREICEQVAAKIKCSSGEELSVFRADIKKCVASSIVESQDIAAFMIDYAIELSCQARDSIKQYDHAIRYWEELAIRLGNKHSISLI